MNIIKTASGNVHLTDSNGSVLKVLINVNSLELKNENEIIVKYGFNQWAGIIADKVASTQVEPNAAIPFSGDANDLITLLSSDFFFELNGGSGDDLATVLNNGNTSGANPIIFDAGQGLIFDNNSRLQEGTIDAGLGGNKGISEICGLGYESKWEGGVRYIMGSSGNTIRLSLYNFATAPSVTDDSTKGYQIGSLWTLDNGTVYLCTDATTGAAVWVLQSNAVPNLSQVLGFGNSAGTFDIDLNFQDITNASIIDFDSTTTVDPLEGGIGWNNSYGTLAVGLKGGVLKAQVGQQEFARVVNKTVPNVDLLASNYQVCIVAGATGQRLSIKLAKADSDANSAGTLGIVAENINKNQEGFICTTGTIEGINTSGSLQGETWADGDLLYLSGTTFGAITNVKPIAPIHEVRVGYVEYAHINKGKIYVKIDNGYEINELHNVDINTGTLANNDALIYESSTQLWKNKTIATALGFTPTTNARTISINGTSQDLSANRTYTITDANLSTSDITTNDVSTTKHGFTPKAPNSTTRFLRGDATWAALPVEIQLAASDETTALTTGTNKLTFRMPHAMTLTAVRASLTTAQTSGSIFTVDINQGGVSVLGTKLTIDNTEKTSTTAATAATITTSALTDDAEITIDIDQIGDGTAKGLKLTLIGTR